ncbi:MAG: OsmC family protein [Dokdonella sp.]
MTTRKASAEWKGGVPEGDGEVNLGSGAFKGPYGFRSRMGDGVGGTNPEELIGAAHAACFSMALSLMLTQAGHPPVRVHTDASVHLEQHDGGYRIPLIELRTRAEVPGITADQFADLAEQARVGCPVSKALAGVTIELDAVLA